MLGIGALAYVLTIMQRTSLGVAGLAATDRFGIDAGTLSAFVFLQVIVYVLALVPAGLSVDRWGSRRMLAISGVLLTVGQLVLAWSPNLGVAVIARVVVGSGDALVFSAVLALVPRWFEARRVPMVAQMVTILGQLGQILSAVPFAALLHGPGWTPAFLTAAGGSALVTVLVIAAVRNGPGTSWQPAPATSPRQILGQLRDVWRRPGTRVGFFGHMGTQFSMMVFALLWGVPYLVSGQHLTAAEAGGMISLFVVAGIAISPVMATLTARHPLRRSWLLLAVIALQATTWTAVLLQDGPAPRWLLVVLVVVLAAGGPGSMVGIDIGRTTNPQHNMGLAQSLVNLGGFLATLLTLLAIGVLLTALGGFSPEAFRIAWLVQYPVWIFAVSALVLARRKARRLDAERGIVPRPILRVIAASVGH